MTEDSGLYTSQLGAGLGLVEETGILLEIWRPGMDAASLYQAALNSGGFPNISARRLKNMVVECFAPRYLVDAGAPAQHLKKLGSALTSSELAQLLLLYTCRANRILADFIRQSYWDRYMAGHDTMSNQDARAFVKQALHDGKTRKCWSDNMVKRVSSYLTGCCADYGLLEKGRKSSRKMLPFRLENKVAAYLAYDLHFAGLGDNRVIGHEDWALFGLDRSDARNELKRLSLKGYMIIQAAGDVSRISWHYPTMEALTDVIAQS
ncbi:BrxA family protein [Candidatus Entotheonella palauensis]|uniref:Membrane protein n=1 Tax=Candidatus Entotheonella gemina TaxID=1429439 RepID=W4M388_9BACT|nr:BrxA family protein [Candidatus Entotheonella palauensis]ETX04774.1 MAG: membrane protein [Candidatus Entotheonella gemina]